MQTRRTTAQDDLLNRLVALLEPQKKREEIREALAGMRLDDVRELIQMAEEEIRMRPFVGCAPTTRVRERDWNEWRRELDVEMRLYKFDHGES